jgi:hypothetical protein
LIAEKIKKYFEEIVFTTIFAVRKDTQMAELVDALDSKSCFGKRSAGSIPVLGTQPPFRGGFFMPKTH